MAHVGPAACLQLRVCQRYSSSSLQAGCRRSLRPACAQCLSNLPSPALNSWAAGLLHLGGNGTGRDQALEPPFRGGQGEPPPRVQQGGPRNSCDVGGRRVGGLLCSRGVLAACLSMPLPPSAPRLGAALDESDLASRTPISLPLPCSAQRHLRERCMSKVHESLGFDVGSARPPKDATFQQEQREIRQYNKEWEEFGAGRYPSADELRDKFFSTRDVDSSEERQTLQLLFDAYYSE